MGVPSYFPEKRKLCIQNLTQKRKQRPVVTLQQLIYYNIFILRLWLTNTGRSGQGVQFMNFSSQMFFNHINHGYRAGILKKRFLWLFLSYMVVTTYCYYEKVQRTMRLAPVSYLLKRSSSCKKKSPVCMLQMQLASMNVFYNVINGRGYLFQKLVVTLRLF